MYKLLIADDEPKIRNGLRKMIDYCRFGIEVVGEAEDGEIALQQVNEKNPDVIFLDICMPFLNGLELIRKIRASDKQCLVVIVTGYDQYPYMQEAIKLQVFDYLLKPISHSSMEETLKRICGELKRQRGQSRYFEWMNECLSENREAIRSNFVRRMVQCSLEKEQIAGGLDYFHIGFPQKCGVAVFHRRKNGAMETGENSIDGELMLYGIQNITSELLDVSASACVTDEGGNLVVLGNTKGVTEWNSACRLLHSHFEEYLGCTLLYECNVAESVFGVSDVYRLLSKRVREQTAMKPVTASILQYIKGNYYDRGFSVEQTARKYQITPSYLSRLLKTETGFSFIDLLTKIRIQKAMEMIASSPLKIYEIAELVGYSNQYYFSRAFKKVTGYSPVRFREGGAREKEG